MTAPTAGTDAEFSLATLRRFLPYMWPDGQTEMKRRVVFAMILVVIGKAVPFLMGFAYSAAINQMAGGTSGSATVAMALVVAYAAARFGGTFFDNLRNVVFERVGQDATRALAEHSFRHLHTLSLRFHLARRTGAVSKIIERGTKSIDVMLYFLLFNIAPTVLELIAVGVTFWIKFGWELVAATAVMVVAYVTYTSLVTNWRNKLRKEMNDLDTGAAARAVDSLLNYETVKYFTAEQRELDRYAESTHRYAKAAVKNENSLAWLNIGQALITNLMMGGAMAYSVWGWSRGQFTAGDVVLVNTLLAQLFRPLDLLGMVYRTVRQGVIDMAAMFNLVDTAPEVVDQPGAPPLAVGAGHVRFEGVRFGYEDDRQILKGVDIAIPPGRTVAIVGPSGAGKSTLGRLLFRFYDPQAGRILIDGQDIRRVAQTSLRAAIGIVPQDSVLFNDTIGYNIAYGREGASHEEVVAAARGAAIHDFIESLPQGYDTEVGERGLKLSGGEKQRVAIARTLLKDPPILLLDEATSALDSRTEAEIQSVIKRVERGRSTLVIAHRLSTIADADEIVVMDGGRVVERGRHAQLLDAGGLYAEMWDRQASEREEAGEAVAAE